MRYKYLMLLLLVALCSCNSREKITPERTISRSIYHWKSTVALTDFERTYLKESNFQKVYVRLFDVTWDQARNDYLPVSITTGLDELPTDIDMVPVIYITVETMRNIGVAGIEEMAANLLNGVAVSFGEEAFYELDELQIDCDWTISTKDQFFALLRAISSQHPNKNLSISATIRLHQVKFYKDTGVPPVDKGILMFYNMGQLNDTSTSNSIYDPETAAKYLYNFEEYPLSLDVALPIFSWAVIIREGKPIQLINGVGKSDLAELSSYKMLNNGHIEIKSNQFFKGRYIYRGDILRLEEMTPELSITAAQQIADYIYGNEVEVILYHLDESLLKKYSTDDLEKIFGAFR